MKTQFNRNGLIRLVLAGVIGLMFVMGSGAPAWADLEDVLLEKGTITKEDWLKIKADKEKTQAGKDQSKSKHEPLEYRAASGGRSKPTAPVGGGKPEMADRTDLLKGVEVGVTTYFDFTGASGTSFTGNPQNGVSNATANNNKGLASGFHFTRSYLNVRKYFENGDHVRLTLDQMVNNVGGNSCPNANTSAGNCHEASPFGLAGFAGTGRNNTFVKYLYYDHLFVPGVQLRIGMHQTPWIEYEESRWTYRYLVPTMVDQQNFQTSSDMGVSLLGKVLDNRLGYHFSFQEGEGYQNTADGRGFALLGRVSVEPVDGVIISAFGHNERERNGVEGFNPQRFLGNVEVYDPTSDRFKVNAQMVWADDGADIGKALFAANKKINVPGTYNSGVGDTTAVTYGGVNGPTTGIPRFHQARGYEIWTWYRIPGFEKVRLHGRYYFMKPNKDTPAGDIQSYYAGISYDYSKNLAFSFDYTILQETVLGSGTVPNQSISSAACATCGEFVNYNNQIIGLRAMVTF
ncbi:MAG: hypothetical protein HY976_01400 [Candidatus Kerfeldbacteria bacterium]|nr:hypothetical protein [Candidatus Kerfeldbacteria bacterium]